MINKNNLPTQFSDPANSDFGLNVLATALSEPLDTDIFDIIEIEGSRDLEETLTKANSFILAYTNSGYTLKAPRITEDAYCAILENASERILVNVYIQ